jgi:small subunit ribosomal protein S16
MLTIRLTRVGKKNDPSYRVIVVESKRKPQPGAYLEMVGSYEPKSGKTELKAERIKHWMSHGATVSDTVHNMLVSKKIIDAKKINVLPKFVAKEEPKVEAPADVPAADEPAAEAAAEEVSQEAVVTSTETDEKASSDACS